jgi:hypothetical protein
MARSPEPNPRLRVSIVMPKPVLHTSAHRKARSTH